VRRAALVALTLIACGQPAQHTSAHALTFAFNQGDQHSYALHESWDNTIGVGALVQPTHIEVSARETLAVTSVSKGVANATITFADFKLDEGTPDGTVPTSTFPATTEQLQIAADGRVLTLGGISLTVSRNFRMTGTGNWITALISGTAVNPGDSWSKEYDEASPVGSGGTRLSTKSTYLRNEMFQGENAAVVETSSSETSDITIKDDSSPPPTEGIYGARNIGRATSDVTTWIDLGTHQILKTRMTARTEVMSTYLVVPAASPASTVGPDTKTAETLDLNRLN
jgi:hypothetical protein